MGISDREYYQDEDRRGGELFRPPRSVVVITLLIWGGLFLIDLFANQVDLRQLLALRPDAWRRPWEAYTLLTSSLVHPPNGVISLIFHGFFLYFLGSRLEQVLGKRAFAVLMIAGAVAGNLLWFGAMNAVGTIARADVGKAMLFSPGAPLAAATMLFCLKYPFERVYLFGVFALPVWAVGLLFFVGDFVGILASLAGAWGGPWPASLGGALVGLAWWKFVPKGAMKEATGYGKGGYAEEEGEEWKGEDYTSPWVDPLQGVRPSWWRRMKESWRVRRSGLKIHAPAATAVAAEPEDDPESRYRELDAQADAVLDKIRRLGEGSLTSAERRTLEAYSRRMRQKLR